MKDNINQIIFAIIITIISIVTIITIIIILPVTYKINNNIKILKQQINDIEYTIRIHDSILNEYPDDDINKYIDLQYERNINNK